MDIAEFDLRPDDLAEVYRRLWVNDPGHLVVRPEIREREAWVSYLDRDGGVALSGDRLSALDEHGLELTRRVLAGSKG